MNIGMMIGANEKLIDDRLAYKQADQYSPGQKVIIGGTEMFFSHYISPNKAFFHYYVEGKQYGYIKHDNTREL